MKSKFVCLCLLLCVGLPALAAKTPPPPGPKFAGSFNITGYKEPGLNGPYTWCFNFTTTGTVLGYPNSGTWNVPSYTLGWSGEWYQDGDEIILHGVADGTYLFSWKGLMINTGTITGRQVEFFISGSTDTAGTFYGAKLSGSCPAAAATAKTGDPSE